MSRYLHSSGRYYQTAGRRSPVRRRRCPWRGRRTERQSSFLSPCPRCGGAVEAPPAPEKEVPDADRLH